MGDFYLATADRFLDPAREAEYRSTGSYAAGHVTDYMPGLTSLTRLFEVTRDRRYLEQAERMAAFFERFDTLPVDHSHGHLITHDGLLQLYEITGKPHYLHRVQRRWREAVEGGYIWPLGGMGEKFRVSYEQDEGCSLADWLRLNLRLWRLTGDPRCLELVDRLLCNHYAMNRAANGGYGHRHFICDPEGPRVARPTFTEAVWCCTFDGLLGLHTLRSHVFVGAECGAFVNFPIAARGTVRVGPRSWPLEMSTDEGPGMLSCTVQLGKPETTAERPDVLLRRPGWADHVTVSNPEGTMVDVVTEAGYLRLTPQLTAGGGVRVRLHHAPRVEGRRLQRLRLNRETVERLQAVTLCDGPRLLLANVGESRPVLVAVVGGGVRVRLSRSSEGGFPTVSVARLDASTTSSWAPWGVAIIGPRVTAPNSSGTPSMAEATRMRFPSTRPNCAKASWTAPSCGTPPPGSS
jgi:hypothetical protein